MLKKRLVGPALKSFGKKIVKQFVVNTCPKKGLEHLFESLKVEQMSVRTNVLQLFGNFLKVLIEAIGP